MKQIGLYIIPCFLLANILFSIPQKRPIISFEDFPLEVNADYKKVWVEEFSNNLGAYYFYELKEPKVIQSYPIKGSFRVNRDGILYGFILSENHFINGTMIPKESQYQRYFDDLYFISLSKDTTIKGYPVYHKEDGFIFWTENNVGFYNDGNIKSFGLSEAMVINGIPCNASKNNRRVMLFKNGELRQCCLSENTIIQEYPCYGGDDKSDVWFKDSGELLSFILSKDYIVDGKLYTKGTQIIFNENGRVHNLSGHLQYLSFHNNDVVNNVVLKDDLEVNGIFFSKDSRLIFNKNCDLISTRPQKNIIISAIPCKKKKWVQLYPNGKVKECILSTNFEINDTFIKKGSQVNFDEHGKLFIE